jgi:hypothetical protein
MEHMDPPSTRSLRSRAARISRAPTVSNAETYVIRSHLAIGIDRENRAAAAAVNGYRFREAGDK